jgi:glycolate oxidase FAD binding subunit
VRLSGSAEGVRAAGAKIGGAAFAAPFWDGIREQTDPFFSGREPLWRLSVPSTSPPLELQGRQLIEWNGALRWLKSNEKAQTIRDATRSVKGHATLFRAEDKSAGCFSPLEPVLERVHRELKAAFDPGGIFNPGRMYPEL